MKQTDSNKKTAKPTVYAAVSLVIGLVLTGVLFAFDAVGFHVIFQYIAGAAAVIALITSFCLFVYAVVKDNPMRA